MLAPEIKCDRQRGWILDSVRRELDAWTVSEQSFVECATKLLKRQFVGKTRVLAGYFYAYSCFLCRFLGDHDLITWANSILKENIKEMEEFADGTAFCRLLDCLFLSSFPLHKVLFARSPNVAFPPSVTCDVRN